mmetsp:Transcript_28021/g.45105  ORF Transcript_28021/g.45105 Transcript_28021/m.45105 type:complete len:271 (+) Transcript_28021:360-1172(+)
MREIWYVRRGLARVGLGGLFLGTTLATGWQLWWWSPIFGQFGGISSATFVVMLLVVVLFIPFTKMMVLCSAYMFSVSLFHIMEFIMTALFNPHTLTYDSYLLNHSREYHMALVASILEYIFEAVWFPSLKRMYLVCVIGIIMSFIGQVIRSTAMFQAQSNFTHQIAETKRENHKLVTSGIYSLCRHPSYCGWFWWALATQIILVNPINFVAYTIVSWKFFNERIQIEESFLVKFFPDYEEYRRDVWSGIPGIGGPWAPKSLFLQLMSSRT